jgi:FkbM family methyltransferase
MDAGLGAHGAGTVLRILLAVDLAHQERWYLETLPLEGEVIADVGANVGRLSQFFFDHAGPTGRVVSIEPVPDNVRVLEARVRAAASNRWTVVPRAVSTHTGELSLRVIDVDYGKNACVVPDRPGALRVPCTELERLVPDATVVKLDIEGHEHAILPGALAGLGRARAWALELHMVEGAPLEATLGLFAARGYRLSAAGRRRDDPGGPWLDVAIPPSLSWAQIPAAPSEDGMGAAFKMLHVIARR